jgi:hypothetical protein
MTLVCEQGVSPKPLPLIRRHQVYGSLPPSIRTHLLQTQIFEYDVFALDASVQFLNESLLQSGIGLIGLQHLEQ